MLNKRLTMLFWIRWIALCLACLGSLLVAHRAAAQTIEVVTLEREDRVNSYMLQPYQINQEDCLNNDTLTFNLRLQGVGNQTIQVWEGMGCNVDTNRDSADDPCTLVNSYDSGVTFIELTVPQILAVANSNVGPGISGEGSAGAGGASSTPDPTVPDAGAVDTSVCRPTSGDGITVVTLHFLLVSGEMAVASAAVQEFRADLRGPGPPTNVEVGVGDGALVINFDASTDNAADIAGYRLFCEECSAGTLTDGGDPPVGTDIYDCGTVDSMADEGQTSGLANGTEFSVRVAAFDKFGNVGQLSVGQCGTPQLVTGFYEAYRAGGGKGGGAGLCSLNGPGRLGLGALGTTALLLFAAAARRARTSRRRP